MESEGVLLPLFHKHLMMPWSDVRKGDCCGRLEPISDGYYCKICDFFVHKKCGESPECIQHTSHSIHTLELRRYTGLRHCDLCERLIVDLYYRCDICSFNMDLHCAKYPPPPEVIDISETHGHKLILLKTKIQFYCDAKCGKMAYGFPYLCVECDVYFHVDCVWQPPEVEYPSEVNHYSHSLHPLKHTMGKLPDYSDGTCRLCTRKIDERLFYHCSSCNFTLDMNCVVEPPPQSFLDSKAHDHKLTLLPRLRTFTCNACGLEGDRSPYICIQCDFMIHQDCLDLPRLININRHEHRVARTSVLGVINSVCGVCREKVDWTCGGYSCQRCPSYVVHSICATREDVWNGEELEGVPEEEEDIEPYVVIDDNTIHHFSHKEHYLRLSDNCKDNKHCNACTQPISLESFYGCMDCDFMLHQNCAQLPTRKRHVLHNERLTLVPSVTFSVMLVLECPMVSNKEYELCDGCDRRIVHALICIRYDCGFTLDFKCTTLPQVVKHRIHDHPLSLFYGEEASGKYWCDICEAEINTRSWFYTCKDREASLHTKCVLGDFTGLMPRSTVEVDGRLCEVVLNNSMSRPFCRTCKSHCIYPIVLKMLGTADEYICSFQCIKLSKLPRVIRDDNARNWLRGPSYV
ncbi:unnamed protein product [Microthlaspi erraticum]|uniref:Phorbol-ester/DAG-type domain-containing protein n=1 Tax=Microthlaspi erraticum TaxID=1685480 RepID=A0A6D2KI56_9BRAS|nr:unnamed protein product [Microthlaspi erraticum]